MTKKPFENKIKKIKREIGIGRPYLKKTKSEKYVAIKSKDINILKSNLKLLKDIQTQVQKEIDKFWEERKIKKVSEKEYIPSELKDFVKRGIKITKKKYTIFDENNKQELLISLGEIK